MINNFSVFVLIFHQVYSQELTLLQNNETAPRIVGGQNALISQVPWQGYFEAGSRVCGCSLIGQTWALTAAHCTADRSASQMTVYFGITSTSSATSGFGIQEFFDYPNYNSQTFSGDISLLRINGIVTYSSNIQPIALPTAGVAVADGVNCTISGWGTTVEGGTASSQLQIAFVPIVNIYLCSCWYNTQSVTIYTDQICAGYEAGGVDTCQGDSGGPLACPSSDGTFVLEGVTSFGVGCARSQLPGVYAEVSHFVTWIEEKMSESATSSSLALSASSVSVETQNDNKTAPRIVGGQNALISQVPWQGYLNAGGRLCGCSLISQSWALTAAHCTADRSASQLRVYFGITLASSAVFGFGIQEFFDYPDYNSQTFSGDISLLRISGNVAYSSNIQPIALPTAGVAVADGVNCVISGWGTTVEDGTVSSQLQIATVPIVNIYLCTCWYNARGTGIYTNQICAGYEAGGIDSCQGDSGGPLACPNNDGTFVLEGVTSFGIGCARSQLPGVYAEVSDFVPWIEETMSNYTASSSTPSVSVATHNYCLFISPIALLLFDLLLS